MEVETIVKPAIEVWLIGERLHNLASGLGLCCGFSSSWHDVFVAFTDHLQ